MRAGKQANAPIEALQKQRRCFYWRASHTYRRFCYQWYSNEALVVLSVRSLASSGG